MQKFIDFSVVKEAVSLSDALQYLDLEQRVKLSGNQFRGPCPCGRGGERALVITPKEGWFCHGAGFGGDVIALAKHVMDLPSMKDAALYLADAAGIRTSTTSTVPGERERPRQEPESGRQTVARPREAAKPSAASQTWHFNADEFADKLQYTDEVEELGITEEEARALGIGMYRGKLYQAARWPNGEIAAFASCKPGELKLPKQLIPQSDDKVVPLRRPA